VSTSLLSSLKIASNLSSEKLFGFAPKSSAFIVALFSFVGTSHFQ
jgi:hypothetical protein